MCVFFTYAPRTGNRPITDKQTTVLFQIIHLKLEGLNYLYNVQVAQIFSITCSQYNSVKMQLIFHPQPCMLW